jgi:L-rhamnose-H+ transport protein
MMGYLLVITAGILQGAFILPMKSTKKWAWEDTWFVYASTGFLILPWLFVLLTIPHPIAVLATTSMRSLVLVEVFGLGWGMGAVTFGLGVKRLGMALGYTIIIGLAATAGALIPMVVVAPEKLGQPQGLLTLTSLALVLIGLALGAWGGKLREPEQNSTGNDARSSFAIGVAICVASGLLSSCANLGFSFGGEYARRAMELGAPGSMASNSIWAPLTLPLFICNAGYCIWLMRKNTPLLDSGGFDGLDVDWRIFPLRARHAAVGFFGDLGGMGRHDDHDGHYRKHPGVHIRRVEGREPQGIPLGRGGRSISDPGHLCCGLRKSLVIGTFRIH